MLARIATPVATLLLFSCVTAGPIEVNTEYVPGQAAELATYRTYAWIPQPKGTDPELYPPGVEKNVKDAVNRILQKRGYREVASTANPDFKIGWHAAIDRKLRETYVDTHYGYYWGGYGVGGAVPVMQEYDVGTLILDFANAKDELVWRGTANAEIYRKVSATEKRERIEKAAAKILERFPPKPE